MIEDAEVLRALQPTAGQVLIRPRSGYSLRVVSVADGVAHVQLIRGSAAARARLNLPSSGQPMPWLYGEPENAEDWVGQLLVFLDEEVETLGLEDGRAREEVEGESYVIVTGYGFKLTDTRRHERLERLAGPDGAWSRPPRSTQINT